LYCRTILSTEVIETASVHCSHIVGEETKTEDVTGTRQRLGYCSNDDDDDEQEKDDK